VRVPPAAGRRRSKEAVPWSGGHLVVRVEGARVDELGLEERVGVHAGEAQHRFDPVGAGQAVIAGVVVVAHGRHVEGEVRSVGSRNAPSAVT
jgi:hypothetical protein